VLVIPEDDADRQLATGFVLEVRHERKIQVLEEAGGWLSVCEKFRSEHIRGLREYPNRYVVLLLDFDERDDRADQVMANVPADLKSRVFLLGVRSEPEALKQAGLGRLEDIGRLLAKDCRDGTKNTWGHTLLQHNTPELSRLEQTVRSILF
jgi:hypothetical protein